MFGGLFATFAIVQRLQGNGRIYWLHTSSTPTFFGSYANKNHYAGLLEMILPFALLGALRSEAEGSKRLLFAFSASIMVASVFLSGSRSGIAIVIFQIIIVAAVIFPLSRGEQTKTVLVWPATALAVGLVLWIAGGSLLDQAVILKHPTADLSFVNRRQLARDSLELVKQKPILGWGPGTFPWLYPQVSSWYSDSLVNAAHDDYLQLLVETGVAGLGLMLAFLTLVLYAGAGRFSRAPTGAISAALLGCCGLLVHSFSDFNLHVPANAAIFWFLCGMICTGSTNGLGRARFLSATSDSRLLTN